MSAGPFRGHVHTVFEMGYRGERCVIVAIEQPFDGVARVGLEVAFTHADGTVSVAEAIGLEYLLKRPDEYVTLVFRSSELDATKVATGDLIAQR